MAQKINSKKKGSKNERDISKLFQSWTGYEFSRTPMSGGLAWHSRDKVSGDIICTDSEHTRFFRFSIEAKFHKEINFEELINGNIGCDILKFWEQASEDAQLAGKVPLLMFRKNGMKKDMHYVAIPGDFFGSLVDLLDGPVLHYIGKYHIVIFNSEHWFSTDYKKIHQLAKEYLKAQKS